MKSNEVLLHYHFLRNLEMITTTLNSIILKYLIMLSLTAVNIFVQTTCSQPAEKHVIIDPSLHNNDLRD